MKSTIKVVSQPQAGGLVKPVIKIVQPYGIAHADATMDVTDTEDDGRDGLIRTLLQHPCNLYRNYWFQLGTHFSIPFESDNPTHYVSNIEAIDERDLYYRFKHTIINNTIPYDDIVKINRGEIPELAKDRPTDRIHESFENHKKIMDFFEWLEDVGYCSYDERQPNDPDGRPRN